MAPRPRAAVGAFLALVAVITVINLPEDHKEEPSARVKLQEFQPVAELSQLKHQMLDQKDSGPASSLLNALSDISAKVKALKNKEHATKSRANQALDVTVDMQQMAAKIDKKAKEYDNTADELMSRVAENKRLKAKRLAKAKLEKKQSKQLFNHVKRALATAKARRKAWLHADRPGDLATSDMHEQNHRLNVLQMNMAKQELQLAAAKPGSKIFDLLKKQLLTAQAKIKTIRSRMRKDEKTAVDAEKKAERVPRAHIASVRARTFEEKEQAEKDRANARAEKIRAADATKADATLRLDAKKLEKRARLSKKMANNSRSQLVKEIYTQRKADAKAAKEKKKLRKLERVQRKLAREYGAETQAPFQTTVAQTVHHDAVDRAAEYEIPLGKHGPFKNRGKVLKRTSDPAKIGSEEDGLLQGNRPQSVAGPGGRNAMSA